MFRSVWHFCAHARAVSTQLEPHPPSTAPDDELVLPPSVEPLVPLDDEDDDEDDDAAAPSPDPASPAASVPVNASKSWVQASAAASARAPAARAATERARGLKTPPGLQRRQAR